MKVNTGSMWLGREWGTAIKDHLDCADCYIECVYINESEYLMNRDYKFSFFRLMGYGNRFKRYTTTIPKKYYDLVNSYRADYKNKFRVVDKWGHQLEKVEELNG